MDLFGFALWVRIGLTVGLALVVLGGPLAYVLLWIDWRQTRLTAKGIQELELPPSSEHLAEEVSRLQEKDPDFNLGAFERWAGDLFMRTVSPQLVGGLPSRIEVSDGMYRRAIVERAMAQDRGVPPGGQTVSLTQTRTVAVFNDPFFDSIHVLFQWKGGTRRPGASRPDEPPRVYSSDEEALMAGVVGMVGYALGTDGSKSKEDAAAEVWVFVRRPGAKTRKTLQSGCCPHCGAPYDGGETNLCSYCKAVLNSGQYHWVLAQRIDFHTYRGPWREFTGMSEMQARDPGFCPEVIEDRAALIFWKWLLARSERKPEALARLLTPEMRGRLEGEAREMVGLKRRWWVWDAAVAGVDLVLMNLDSDEQRDEVCLRVRWDARAATFPERTPPFVPPASYSTVLTLVRSAGAKTDVRTGVSSDRCRRCLAANSDLDAPQCAYCSNPYTPGEDDFILDDVSTWETWLARRGERARIEDEVAPYVPSFKFVDQRHRLLQMMAVLARSDGEVSSTERALLRLCARRWRVPFARVQAMFDSKVPAPELDIEPGSWTARAFLQGLIAIAAIDGKIDRKERSLICNVARRLKLEVPLPSALDAVAQQMTLKRKEAASITP